MSTATDLEVGIDPKLRHEYMMLIKEIESLEEQQKKADQVLRLFDKVKDYSSSDPAKALLKQKAIRAKLECCDKIPK
jgi:hypothetical protein